MSRFASRLRAAIAVSILLSVSASAAAQTVRHEAFEGSEPSWRDAGGDAQYRIVRHHRLHSDKQYSDEQYSDKQYSDKQYSDKQYSDKQYGEAHSGQGCERLAVLGNHGTHVYIGHEVGRARVIEELVPGVWVRSDRAGLQIIARVVLPRTEDPRTGGPVSTLLHGASYTEVGRWQQLSVGGLPRLLARQVRILRTQLGPAVDGREAYVDRILLNVYGGPGETNVWIDDLEIAGYVAAPQQPSGTGVSPVGNTQASGTGVSPVGNTQAGRLCHVELSGSVLLADRRPMFPRIIRHRGEPLAFLRQLGFNAVWLDSPATGEILEEADRLGLWLICPPPRRTSVHWPERPEVAADEFGPEYAGVLAWDLGSGLSREQLELTRRWVEQIRSADRHATRPLVCRPASDWRGYSRLADVLLIDRRPLGTSLELTDYGTWIRRQPRLARPGTPIWTTVQTQPAVALRQQLTAIGGDGQPPLSVSAEQIQLLVHTAVSAGSRGLLFESDTPLDATDPDTRYRAMALELLNLELQLVEPWAAAGSLSANAEADRPEVVAAVLRTDRSRLLMPIWSDRGAQFVPGQSAAAGLSVLVPGVPESSAAYLLVPGSLQPLRHKRTTGGVRVILDDFGLVDQVLLSQDPLVIDTMSRRCAAIARRAAELTRELAARKLHTVAALHRSLAVGDATRSEQAIAAADKVLRQCDGQLAAGEYRVACVYARRAMRALRAVERADWEATVVGLRSPVTSPGAVAFATLPWHGRLIRQVASSQVGPNRISGGDFENLQAMLAAGWTHSEHALPGVHTAADLVADAARSGATGLRLTVRADDPENPPAMVETPPIWITSAPVPVEAGQLVRLRGWVHVPVAITGSVDGLLIIDSLAGEALAQRIGQTAGWQPFEMVRMAVEPGPATVTFAPSGLGEVRLDDVVIEVLEPAGTAGVTRRPGPRYPR